MFTTIISAAIAAAITAGVCIAAYCIGKSGGIHEAKQESLHQKAESSQSLHNDLLMFCLITNALGFGKSDFKPDFSKYVKPTDRNTSA
jgi:hypothetical protein